MGVLSKRGAARGDKGNSQMTQRSEGRIDALYRYPVKGLTPEAMPRVTLAAGGTMPFDRAYAIENGPGHFDIDDPKHVSKLNFVMLARNEQLAKLRMRFDDATETLNILDGGAEVVRGDLRTAEGRAAIEAFYASYMGEALRGPPRVVHVDGHSFSDVEPKCLHIVNLASVRALEADMGVAINPLRFRPNVIVDGLPAWSEFDSVGKSLRFGAVTFEIFKRTERCPATNVDPETGLRDLKIPAFLSKTYGHSDFGIYGKIAQGGELKVGDMLSV
jgi:uncharacterized protein